MSSIKTYSKPGWKWLLRALHRKCILATPEILDLYYACIQGRCQT